MSVLPQHKTDAIFRVENNNEFLILGYEKTALGLSTVLIFLIVNPNKHLALGGIFEL